MNSTVKKELASKYIFLQGGLGNQLFQIALGEYLKKSEVSILFAPSMLGLKLKGTTHRKFETRGLIPSNQVALFQPLFYLALAKAFKTNQIYIEDDLYTFKEKKVDEILKKKYIIGYFQSLVLVQEVQTEIVTLINKKIKTSKPSNNLTIHVRAGDYLKTKNKKYHGLLSREYYKKAIETIERRDISLEEIRVVTDDIDYSKNLFRKINLKNIDKFIKNNNPWLDLEYLTNSQNIIMANSSFSWWAGFLGHTIHKSTVVMPNQWTVVDSKFPNELIHKDWILV